MQRWRFVLLALAAFLLLPAIPVLRVLVPVEPGTLLLVPALAACAAAGWWAGGRFVLAILWVAVAVWVVARAGGGVSGFADFARGWSVLVAGVFGIVTLAGGPQGFLPRALVTLGLSFAAAGALLLVGGTPPTRVATVVEQEYRERVNEWTSSVDRLLATPEWRSYMTENPATETLLVQAEQQLRTLPGPSARLFPATLALESLAALALAWSLFHRLSRARLGPPLARLRDFRFSDQLVWGLIVGLTLSLLGTLADFRQVGFNLLLFFGALYLLRGLGVLLWFLNPGRAAAVLMSILLVLLWPFVGATALAIGLADTWVDWRNRATPTS